MAVDETRHPAAVRPGAKPPRSRRGYSHKLFLATGAALLALITLAPGSVRAAWARLTGFISVGEEPVPAAPTASFAPPAASLSGLTGQQQAELLMNAVINRDARAARLVVERAQDWRGRLKLTPELTGTLQTALNDRNLLSRTAALEIYLAVYNVAKTPRSAAHLRDVAQHNPQGRNWALWMLGALGNRGIEPDAALATLVAHAHDASEQTRYWTIEGLAHLGTDATIAPLLDAFQRDPSQQVRERAASSLAVSGMLTHTQRATAIPALQAIADSRNASDESKRWATQAIAALQ